MPDAKQSPAKPKHHESKDVRFQEVEERLAAAPPGMQGLGRALVTGSAGFPFQD